MSTIQRTKMISIIIPVYNTSKYLSQCLNSILKQTYNDIEVIIVNDASKDNSLTICKKYALKDKRISIVNKDQNEGVDKARFTGLSIANGDYVTFIDSDDWLCDNNILRKMINKAEETDADYVEMGMQRVMDKHGLIKHTSKQSITGLVKQPELFDKYYISYFGINILAVNMAGKLYRKSVLDKACLIPTGLKMGEDLAFNLKLFPQLNRIYILDNVGYSYRFGGMTSHYNPSLYPNLKKLYLLKEQLIEKYKYYKASDFIKIEIKNVLQSDICQQIIFNVGTKDKIISNINKEISDPLWARALQIENHPNYFNELFVQAIQNKDAEKAYSLCLEKVNKEKWSRLVKRIASSVLRYL